MAINKKLINFKKEADYLKEKQAGNILDTSIVFIDDAKKIVTHQTEFDCNQPDLSDFATQEYVDNKFIDTADTNGHDYVDMGEAGIWAKYPIGVSDWNTWNDDVLYFEWGGIQGYTAQQVKDGEKEFSSSFTDYRFSGERATSSSNTQFTKYCSETQYGKDKTFTDDLTILELEDDAAHVNMGGDWRMPMKEEFQKLYDSCDCGWIKDYNGISGLNGRLFTLKSDNSKQLFIPAAGHGYDGSIEYVGVNGFFWSSSLEVEYPYKGYGLFFITSLTMPQYSYMRFNGKCVVGFIPANLSKKEKYITKEDANKRFNEIEEALENVGGEENNAFEYVEITQGNNKYPSAVLKNSGCKVYGGYSVAEGQNTVVGDENYTSALLNTHAEGYYTKAVGFACHAEGNFTYVSGQSNHVEGLNCYVSGQSSHGEGQNTYVNGQSCHAEGQFTYALSFCCHAEGNYTYAIGTASHAEGLYTYVNSTASHAEGQYTYALGHYTHAEGQYTYAYNEAEHASGRFNISFNSTNSNNGTWMGSDAFTLFTVGNGLANTLRHNAFEIRQSGDIYFSDTNSEGGYYEKPMRKLQDIPMFWYGTEEEYNALNDHNDNTLYFIKNNA